MAFVDAGGGLDLARVRRSGGHTGNASTVMPEVIRIPQDGDLPSALRDILESSLVEHPGRRLMLVGVLDPLYDRRIVTREAARVLGKIKTVLEAAITCGLDVSVVCDVQPPEPGVRAYLVSSLCAMATEVHRWSCFSQQHVESSTAAIA